MPRITFLGQKLWPVGEGQTDKQTEKANTEDTIMASVISFFSLMKSQSKIQVVKGEIF